MLLFLFLVVLQGKSASAVVGPGPICDGWLEQSWPFYLFFQVVLCWNHALWSGQSASVYHQLWTGCCHGLQCCFSPSARSVWCSPISPCSVGRWLCHGHFWCGTLPAGIFQHWLDCPHAQMRASSGICQSPLCFGILFISWRKCDCFLFVFFVIKAGAVKGYMYLKKTRRIVLAFVFAAFGYGSHPNLWVGFQQTLSLSREVV